MADPEAIYHWRRLDDRITTSGQPTEPQLEDIHALGIRHIVNLGLHSHEKALPDETASVSRLGMTYIHIPVDFHNPTEPGFRSILRRDGAVEGCAGARPLHRELPGFGLLLSLPPGCAWHGRGPGARRHGSGLAPRGRLGGVCEPGTNEPRPMTIEINGMAHAMRQASPGNTWPRGPGAGRSRPAARVAARRRAS
jgi:hypothetical protein